MSCFREYRHTENLILVELKKGIAQNFKYHLEKYDIGLQMYLYS
jgi:hypothetical protein